MDLDYDRKFEEMKKYIPFLESMIKRLENTNTGVKNPRKAQLDKIRSLRDLLLDKKKRMKMENLLKCEQVLVNLYAKVEQRDSMTDTKEDDVKEIQNDLNVVRNKLKSVVSKLQDDVPDTLPEIARATNTEVVCTPGSKEPALFQRRPNKASPLRQTTASHGDDISSNSKRHYTRVLMSPEHKKKEWLAGSDASTEKPLFSRRSPRRSPRRYSPSYKKERKKSSKARSKSSQHSKDLNITLKVPEESLGSLNTKDILSRIINCSDSDVDIDTLRELRSQILGELKQTGTKDDISDLILKSYKKTEKHSNKKEEVEEGELSDSESEAIENIYGNLVVLNQGESNANTNKTSSDKKQPRKIQICLVINSEKEKDSKVNDQTLNATLDISDFEAYTETKMTKLALDTTETNVATELNTKQIIQNDKNNDINMCMEEMKTSLKTEKERHESPIKDSSKLEKKHEFSQNNSSVSSTENFKPNFYQPFTEEKTNPNESLIEQHSCIPTNVDIDVKKDEDNSKPVDFVKNIEAPKQSAKVKKCEVVSEIDILQALKKEILGETAMVPISEAITPPLHQPKVTKVASAQEVSKKRISIEKYKQKIVPPVKQPLFNPVKYQPLPKDDNLKKQSLKLTEKECERFNFPVNVSPVDSSEDEDKQRWDYEFLHGAPKSPDFKKSDKPDKGFEFHHGDSVPKSPDHEDFADTGIKPPVIIPSDPVKNIVPIVKADIDMRTMIPLKSPVNLDDSKKSIASPSLTSEKVLDPTWNDNDHNSENTKKSLSDFRTRTESIQTITKNSPNSYLESDRLQRSTTNYPNVLPSISSNIPPLMSLNVSTHMKQIQKPSVVPSINPIMTPILNSKMSLLMSPNMTPNLTPGLVPNMNPNMTPNRMITGMNPIMNPILTPNARSYEMTPRPNFDIEEYSTQKHVYAPIFPTFENDFSEKDASHVNQWESKESSKWDDRNRSSSVQRDVDYHRNRNDRFMGDKRLDSPQIRMECPPTPNPSFGRMECPPTPNPSFGRMECLPTPNPSFGRMECPPTPNPSFGRMECPSTPNPSFGRMECPSTPNPSFGRMECPSTPNPSFGRMECPPTPNPFGRMETPMTPIHSFGRSDCPMTPSHSFGRSDPNMTPTHVYGRSEYHSNASSFSNKYTKSQDPRLNRTFDYDKCQSRNDDNNRLHFEDDYRRSHVKSYDQDKRNSRERMPRRESSVGRTLSRDYESHDSQNNYSKDYRYRRDDVNERNYRARSVGRMNPSEDGYLKQRERGVTKNYPREGSIEKPLSVQSHTGRSFNIDTSFNRTFQETKSSSFDTSFDARRQRASSVGRSLRDTSREMPNRTSNNNKFQLAVSNRKTMQFRRACSVGRDLKDYNADKNLNDIKKDLRSCKFDNYNFNLRDRRHKNDSRTCYTNEKVSLINECHASRNMPVSNTTLLKSNEHHTTRDPRRDDCSKYSPRKNFRDPRMRRDVYNKNTNRDRYRESSSRYKNYGIVYSNDNIAKGTILASTANVKNFKIPKIKRPIEVKEVDTNNKQTENDGKKEFPNKKGKEEGNRPTNQSKKVEGKSIRGEGKNSDKRPDTNKNVKTEKPAFKEDIISSNKMTDKARSRDEHKDSFNVKLDSCEKRITRSAIKAGTSVKQTSRKSPVKKLRRIKKPFVYDSDSDSQDNEIAKNNKNENSVIVVDTESCKNYLDIDNERKIEKSSCNPKQSNETDYKESTYENDSVGNLTVEKDIHVDRKEISIPENVDESCDGPNDSLDISFGVDDELFTDNIAAGSVLDNINALIADLDHDIEAPKINDFNDKFINNIVGSISTPNSPIPLHANQTDLVPDVTFNDKFSCVLDDQMNKKSTNTEIALTKNNTYAIESGVKTSINTVIEYEHKLNVQIEDQNCKSDDLEISLAMNNNENVREVKSIECPNQIQEDIKNLNTDAIVSTTASDEKSNVSNDSTNKTIPFTNTFVADSTNHSNENNANISDKELQEIVPDSTNELASEMNITSTYNSNDVTPKHQADANSVSDDNIPRIDSIGKLLSILEDKNKIKELLTLLSKDSGENEKIKKKLEKLSEIVSDDEETPIATDKDTNTQGNQITDQENKEKTINVVANQPDNDNDHEITADNEKHIKEISEVRSVIPKTQDNNDKSLSESESPLTEVIEKIDDKYQCSNISSINKKQDTAENKLAIVNNKDAGHSVDNKNVNDDVVMEETTTDAYKEVKEDATIKNSMDVKNDQQEGCIQISKVNEIDVDSTDVPIQVNSAKRVAKKSKITKKGRSKLAKKLLLNKRVTRSEAGSGQPQIPSVPKKPSRELKKLQEDIRDMFISEDILNATGIRMCRLAKLVDDKNSKSDSPITEIEPEPIVVLENIKSKMSSDDTLSSVKINKKKTTKNKLATHSETSVGPESKGKPKYKPGPKSKTKKQDDPYVFETESVGDSNYTVDSRDQITNSDSDSVSTKSLENTELKKKTKRKRRSWQLGVIKKKGIKNKSILKNTELSNPVVEEVETQEIKDKKLHDIPDFNCFTDKSYCFLKNIKNYLCRLCGYRGDDIVPHYKKHHPHSEIPLSRLSPRIAKEAIEQCENMILQEISKIQTMQYVCRFCFQEFRKQNTALEAFFWHVVSVHTGEYKHLCSECINLTRCPFNLDIPPPPKNLKGQLIGYICGRCNFTQVSLENLKTHVIIRHDDEQTEVYSINLNEIPKKVLQSLIMKANDSSVEGTRVLRSTRSNQSVTEPSDDYSDVTDSTDRIVSLDVGQDKLVQEINSPVSPKIIPKNKIQSKLIFENDDTSDTSSYSKNDEIIKTSVKLEGHGERQDPCHNDTAEVQEPAQNLESEELQPLTENTENASVQTEITPSSDVVDYPHFKIKLTGTGNKEYVCCINGTDNHYKTTLLISFKKHVQLKHSENWDGYCFVCKVIVTSQGKHKFKDCLQHFLDKHIDNFPIFEEISEATVKPVPDVPEPISSTPIKDAPVPKPYINVRPLSELISSEQSENQDITPSLPKIQSVVSLGASDTSISSKSQKEERVYNYEEAQTAVMAKKHRVVLDAMLTPEKLIQVFKCAGRFCSYTTDNAEEALLHASTHQRIGGECSLMCSYCDFDCSGNAIDLVMHVFKSYNHCSYACSKCFYRAAVSQLVYAHIKRAHTELDADKVPVLSSTTVVKVNMKDDLMSRDAAVLYYICNNRDPEEQGVCQFRSYVLTKFREHLQTRHANDQEYSCYMCNVTMPSSKLLAQHLKSHGLRIYQCCRCLFGADNESDLMAHASAKHPLKQPKAYLRIITSKGGSSEVRVLPLAVLSKSTVATTVVTPAADKESPVKQAERSIDLEKLIGQTNLMIESMNTITNAASIEPVNAGKEKQTQLENEGASRLTIDVEVERSSPAVLTLLKDPQDVFKPIAVVKSEPVESDNTTHETPAAATTATTAAPPEPDVVCLDSDDDSSRHNIIDLSGDDTLVELDGTKQQDNITHVKIPRAHLYKCSKCSLVSKSEGMFKRHIISCYTNPVEPIKCAYCSFSTQSSKIVAHYNNNHLESAVPYICVLCNGKFVSVVVAKKHMRLIHNQTSTVVSSKVSSTGALQYFIDSDVKERQVFKRKLSGETGSKQSEPASKKKYGPQDVDKLPINPILDDLVYCSLCEFSTKVRLNMVRHLQLHAEQQPVPKTAPVNPVPHLESNEKHFDKMVNLASSSIATNKTKDGSPIITEHLSPEAAAIYPKYVPDKHRYTCGAKGCSYISVNESMFKIHWETLHGGTSDYHCVHCPPHQYMDTTKPLTVLRIVSHLKMHDIKLYACSSCTFYHYTRKILEKHLREVHSGKLIIVREDGGSVPPAPPVSSQSSTAPTMDLKPWQCGLCKFKSMIRPEVIEHCGKFHQSKMQFKCMYCGFRTSNIENITKHQSKQHPGKKEEVFYFYYREGSIPDEADGTARWQKQSHRTESQIKTETDVPPPETVPILPKPAPAKPPEVVNLDIVKKEIVEPDTNVHTVDSTEDLCKAFGQFCDPNGLKYKCSLCKVVIEDTKETMQAHLYEELQYRKWGCAVCSYKAFHKPGLQQHVQTEHRLGQDAKEPIELQVDFRIEAWVAKFLDHQTAIIEKNKENLAKQKAEILRSNPGSSGKAAEKPVEPPTSVGSKSNATMAELEKLFGPLGVPSNMNYTCPKCNISARAETVMQEHLESELNKIRWCCNICCDTFQTYHEAQFHCRSIHPGQSSRPVEATRDASLRAAWVAAVLRVQKLSMNYMPVTDAPSETPAQPATDNSQENSLLVVRYEEKVPTPEEQMKLKKKSDVGDDKPTTDESEKKKFTDFECPYCPATYKYLSFFHSHKLKHYGLKPYTCPYCPHTDYKKTLEIHIKSQHPNRTLVCLSTPIPAHAPIQDYLNNPTSNTKPVPVETEKIICLVCEEAMTRSESHNHYHDNVKPQFGMKGMVVYRCWTCLTLHKTSFDFNLHHRKFHGTEKKNSSIYELNDERRSLFCSICDYNFANLAQFRSHQQSKHGLKHVAPAQPVQSDEVIELESDTEAGKRKADDTTVLPAPKRVARKSTTKLPSVMAVAKKSTTKLPFLAPCDDEEYSYYGTKPSMDDLDNVTTLMPFYNTFVPFTLKKFSEIIKIYPVVLVKDINHKT